MVFKKGDKSDPLNYRGIALVNLITKIFTYMIKNRLEIWIESNKILPGAQFGFRAGRGCTEAIFTLLTAVQLQLRLPRREVFAIFVDFRRAFDSVPHENLWNKLNNLGISSKLIRVIKSLYDTANVQVKCNSQLSDKFDVTEGVLQGETLSALLFILRPNAFDTAILVDSHINLHRALRAPADYCDLNGLEVNISKIKIMPFKRIRRLKKLPDCFRKYEGSVLEIVSSYTYLGIPLSRNAFGNISARAALAKGKMATGVALGGLAGLGINSWRTLVILYNVMISSTLLYAIPAWELLHSVELEVAQLDFFKRALALPKCTPGWALRLETNLPHTELRIMKLCWDWLLKILKQSDSLLPKVCVIRLLDLDRSSHGKNPYNWISRIRDLISMTIHEELRPDLNYEELASKTIDIFNSYELILRERDIESWLSLRPVRSPQLSLML
ncbi:uncharacterized protein LOC107040108 [Diachasma alloeum]|uniref:uncharacterized protein LOC107040108 n=1 Tax=Diachasma alloeum TaxID=454923 RepID=UPI0007380F96|nr:uncharacterized protein LOC107040108 [Diachasma alloeum]